MAKKTDLTIKRGTTFPITFQNTTSTGTPIDLTGATVYFTAKKAEFDTDSSDTNAPIKKDVTTHLKPDGTPGATSGISVILLTPADTQKTPGSYNYDITVKYAAVGGADPVVVTPVEGKLTIDGKPTNRSS